MRRWLRVHPRDGNVLPHTVIAAALVFLIQFAHGPATFFLYDAAQYWEGSAALARGGDVIEAGALATRGALTPLVYLAPAALAQLLGPTSAAWLVLIWNAALAAVLCAVVLPRLAEEVGGAPLPRPALYGVALTGGVVISGFSRYPLADVWAATAALGGLLLLLRAARWHEWVVAGVVLVLATGIRPSYLVPVLIATAIIAVSRRMPSLWLVPGAVIALVPQLVLNFATWGTWSVVPVATAALTRVQAVQSAYVVRYDTVVELGRHPQQFFCDPGLASSLADTPPPDGPLELVGVLLGQLPASLGLLLQKAAASLAWSLSTPYEASPDGRLGPVALGVLLLASAGFVALAILLVRGTGGRVARVAPAALGAFWLGSLATLVLSTPETRFALPLLLAGLVGLAVLAGRVRLPRMWRGWALGAGTAAAVIVLAAGLSIVAIAGLAHPSPPGPLEDAASCAALLDVSG